MITILIGVAVVIATLCVWLLIRRLPHPVDQLPGPPTLPFLGNALLFAKPNIESFETMKTNWLKYRPFFRIWLTKYVPIINPLDPKDVETILSSTEHITKSYEYKILADWFGPGLITADGEKWHSRRKLLTPTFHFSILEQFVPVFCEKTRILIEKLRETANSNPDGFNIGPYITDCALEILCETAIGQCINAQDEAYSTYVTNVHKMDHFVSHRIKRTWLLPDWIFRLTPMGREFYKSIKILQDFTDMVVRDGPFLDLLLKVSDNDSTFTEFDIRSEVDTFMAAGHHTTAHAMSWVLHYLSIYPEMQDRCYMELEEIFCGSDRDPSMSDLSKMKFLERFVKETMRIKPPVWFVGRRLEKSLKFDGYDEFPANTVVHVNIYGIHHNPDIYPDPEKFDPDRLLPENCVGRHPYAYIPFSAGPRNCIGQRFAMLEMKEVISTVLRHFRIESCDPELNSIGFPAVVLRPAYGIKVRLYLRN